MAVTGDLQSAVVFLASPASDYMTGSDLIIDGGTAAGRDSSARILPTVRPPR
jgi:NAD(P)-dependent dehydrogenase (short-subunit alcohol dehydrogenase family)